MWGRYGKALIPFQMDRALAITYEETYGPNRDKNLSGYRREGLETGDTYLSRDGQHIQDNWVQQEITRELH